MNEDIFFQLLFDSLFCVSEMVLEMIKEGIIICVTTVGGISSLFILLLLHKARKQKPDNTYPLLLSVFITGIAGFISNIIIIIIILNGIENNEHVVKASYFWRHLSVTENYVSVAILSALKFLAIVAPFTYKRLITAKLVKVIIVATWIIFSVLSVFLTHYLHIVFNNYIKSPHADEEMRQNKINVFSRGILNISVITLIVTSIGFVVAFVLHKIKTQKLLVPSDKMVDTLQRQVVMKAIWSAKGTWILAVLRLTLHIPLLILNVHNSFKPSDQTFFAIWCTVMMVPFWDAACYVGLQKEMRKLAVSMVTLRFLKKKRAVKAEIGSATRILKPFVVSHSVLEPRSETVGVHFVETFNNKKGYLY